MEGSPNTVFIWEKNLMPILYPVEFVDTIFPFYKPKKGWAPKDTLSSLYSRLDEVVELKSYWYGDGWYFLSQMCAVHDRWVWAEFMSLLFYWS